MTNKVKFKSDALEAIYSAAQGLHRAGTIDTSVDQYAATLGKWFGISDADLLTVLPNLANWNVSQRNLGFV